MERLEVEDDEQRERRIQIQLEKLNKSGAPQARKLLNFDFGNRVAWDAGPPTELLSRVQAFLPQIEASNAILAQQAESNPESVDIEHIDEDRDRYIEMNLGLGVFEDRTRRDKEQHKQNATQLSSASSSETSSSSEHDATYDSDSSDPDTDSSSEIITSFEPAPRSIRPLPKRSLASRVKPKIHVLNEAKE
ncbi:hypothetical protein M378DRAFT_19618 [Amanita muscaria Koide BX008]|uniref:Uncharacterized protein n=1 Tax=Amanita muscaria (strain Koide BX008) TaxID=946122 RepID=A0A0C2T5F7_AMAMK|nr:hypothetical protein M378DRAFT_19618 [Amanita muscaria Koide BX008]